MNNALSITAVLGLALALSWGSAAAQEAQESSSTLPPGTNPFERIVYPSGSQDEPTQQADQLACYRWASEQTAGWDPYVAYQALVEAGYVAQEQASAAAGGAVRGAAGGALAGVAIGAIAGDAGEGAAIGAIAGGVIGRSRSRRAQAEAQAGMDAAIKAFQEQAQKWDRAWTACMEARNYSIS